MSNAAEYKWVFLWSDPGRKVVGDNCGVSFWRDESSGRLSVGELDGSLPHEIEDGPFWIDRSRPLQFHLGHEGVGFHAYLHLAPDDSSEFMTDLRWEAAAKACRDFNLKAEVWTKRFTHCYCWLPNFP